MKQTQNQPNTKQKIVKTALRLFLEKGFYNVSMQNISKEIGISKPAIYHHYHNKDQMIDAVLDYFSLTMAKWSKEYFKNEKKDLKLFLEQSFAAIPIFKNVETILLAGEENIDNLKYTYNEFIITIAKYSPRYRDRISLDTIEARKVNEYYFLQGQKAGVINNKHSAKNLAMICHALIEGLSFIAEIDSSVKVEDESLNMFKTFWKLITE